MQLIPLLATQLSILILKLSFDLQSTANEFLQSHLITSESPPTTSPPLASFPTRKTILSSPASYRISSFSFNPSTVSLYALPHSQQLQLKAYQTPKRRFVREIVQVCRSFDATGEIWVMAMKRDIAKSK
ncbi:hypothetical protein EAE99_001850 [Botrytis elliptica]|nr:hypothetical protein EAE99_001850 [Botrytis elliptica]